MTVCYRCIPAVIQNSNILGECSPETAFPKASKLTLPAKTPTWACPWPKHWPWISPRRAARTGENKTQLGEGKKIPQLGFFCSTMVWFFLATPTSLEKNTSQAHKQPATITQTSTTHHPTTLAVNYHTNHPTQSPHPFSCLPASQPSPSVCRSPQERCSWEPQNSPCLQKSQPEPAWGPNTSNKHHLNKRLGPGKKNPAGGRQKNIPQLSWFGGVFILFCFKKYVPNSYISQHK